MKQRVGGRARAALGLSDEWRHANDRLWKLIIAVPYGLMALTVVPWLVGLDNKGTAAKVWYAVCLLLIATYFVVGLTLVAKNALRGLSDMRGTRERS